MVVVLQKAFPETARLVTALSENVTGISKRLAQQVCDRMGVGHDVKVGDLSAEQVERLTYILQKQFKTGPDVHRREREYLMRLIRMGS